jgi:hypothetical protein
MNNWETQAKVLVVQYCSFMRKGRKEQKEQTGRRSKKENGLRRKPRRRK